MRISLLLTAAALLTLCSCSGAARYATDSDDHASDSYTAVADTLTLHSSLLTLAELPEGCGGATVADIRNPWDESGRTFLARLLLVPRDSSVPEGLEMGRIVLRTPVRRAAVFSSIHTSALQELGALEAIVAVADGGFFPAGDTITALMSRGAVSDVGPSEFPDLEKLIASHPEAVLLSPMQGVQTPGLPKGAVAVPMADYMETSPIARAEWLLLLGKLSGTYEEAAGIFDRVVNDYCDLQLCAELAPGPKPLVITDTEYQGTWHMPAGGSYASRMIADAGGRSPWTDTPGTGAVALNMERVLADAMDADIWLIRTYGSVPTKQALTSANPLNAKFKAFREGGIYGCDSEKAPIFSDAAFHPEKVLADMVAIFHPEALPDHKLRYYQKVE